MPWDNAFYMGVSLEEADFKKLKDWLPNYRKPVDPDWTYAPFAGYHDNMDLSRTGLGLPIITWKWNIRQNIHIETLRVLIPFLSAPLYIRSPLNQANETTGAQLWRTFLTQALWMPKDEDKAAKKTLGFMLTFRGCLVQEEIE